MTKLAIKSDKWKYRVKSLIDRQNDEVEKCYNRLPKSARSQLRTSLRYLSVTMRNTVYPPACRMTKVAIL